MPKKTITLPNHVLKVAEQEAHKYYGGSLSIYLQALINKDKCEEVEIEFEKEQSRKPKRASEITLAKFKNVCPICGRKIYKKDKICNALIEDGHYQYVHKGCCKD
jgi:hypothetical protein